MRRSYLMRNVIARAQTNMETTVFRLPISTRKTTNSNPSPIFMPGRMSWTIGCIYINQNYVKLILNEARKLGNYFFQLALTILA